MPAKATGNDQFDNAPGRNDWYETVKLNYGVDYYAGQRPENLNLDLNANLDANHKVAYLNHMSDDHCSSHHLYLVRLQGRTREDANKVIEQMAERGIACNVHYKPLPMMTAYKALGFDIKDYPNAYHLFENEVTLPLHTKLTDEDVEYIIENFVDIVKSL